MRHRNPISSKARVAWYCVCVRAAFYGRNLEVRYRLCTTVIEISSNLKNSLKIDRRRCACYCIKEVRVCGVCRYVYVGRFCYVLSIIVSASSGVELVRCIYLPVYDKVSTERIWPCRSCSSSRTSRSSTSRNPNACGSSLTTRPSHSLRTRRTSGTCGPSTCGAS